MRWVLSLLWCCVLLCVAVFSSVLQCVAVCCSLLQSVAVYCVEVCCSVQCVETRYNLLRPCHSVQVRCILLQSVAVMCVKSVAACCEWRRSVAPLSQCCSVLNSVAVCCSVMCLSLLQCVANRVTCCAFVLQCVAVFYSVLRFVAVSCGLEQCVAPLLQRRACVLMYLLCAYVWGPHAGTQICTVQCVAVWNSVLQSLHFVAVCCSVVLMYMLCVYVWGPLSACRYVQSSVLQSIDVCCSVLQSVAMHCSVLQCTTVYCSGLQCAVQCVAVY